MSQTKRAYTRTADRLQTGPMSASHDLQLTAIRSSGLPFNGRYSRNPCNPLSIHELLLMYQPRRDGRLNLPCSLTIADILPKK